MSDDNSGDLLHGSTAINEILGSSVRSSAFFTLQDDILAYTAGSGVVVCQLDSTLTKICSQRFFCVNASQYMLPMASSSANAYLNMIRNDRNGSISGMSSISDSKRDTFGYSHEPIIAGSGSEQNGSGGSPLQDPTKNINTTSTTKTSPSKLNDRIRSISCLAISPNKTLLAVGESGYQPRIALFSLASDLTSSPIALVYEHAFGISSITFSPDLQYFCSLGLINDGFLNIWKVSPSSVQLQASNKCTSVINQVLWHENYIITLGLRILKVWKYEQIEESTTKLIHKTGILKGKNVLLGPLMNSNFIQGSSLNADEILIISELNQLLLLKLQYENLKLVLLESPPILNQFSAMCIDYTNEKIWFGGCENVVESISMNQLKTTATTSITKSTISPTKINPMFNGSPLNPRKSISNTESTISKIIDLDSSKLLIYTSTGQNILIYDKITGQISILVGSLIKNLSGIKQCYLNDIFVFSHDGQINQIEDGRIITTITNFKLPVSNDLISNSLTCVDYNGVEYALGDKYGNIFVGQLTSENHELDVRYHTKAHESTVNDIIFFELEKNKFICSISRDRMIQVFYKTKSEQGTWDILQTLPTHSGNVLKVFYEAGFLFVCSADRTISIHKIEETESEIQIVQIKVISLKNAPLNMKVHGNDLIVSTNDKNLLIYNIPESFELVRTLKLWNERINESLLIENFVVLNQLIVVSSSDKSLRTFNYQLGKPIAVYWGHLDTILSLILKSDDLLSIGMDGCLFNWNIGSLRRKNGSTNVPVKDSSATTTSMDCIPLYSKVTRKIISNNSISTTSPQRKLQQPVPPLSPNKVISPDEYISPTPATRLTTATLKRMESKRNSMDLSPKRIANTTKTPTKLINISPSRSAVRSPIHTSFAHNKKRMLLDNVTNSLANVPNFAKIESCQFMERSLAHLDYIKSGLLKSRVSELEKIQLKSALEEIQDLLGDKVDGQENGLTEKLEKIALEDNETKMKENELLEKYSDKLMDMFQAKLSLSNIKRPSLEGNGGGTPGIFRRVYSNGINTDVD